MFVIPLSGMFGVQSDLLVNLSFYRFPHMKIAFIYYWFWGKRCFELVRIQPKYEIVLPKFPIIVGLYFVYLKQEFYLMTDPANLPELIIALSRDKVRLQLLADKDAGREDWSAIYPIEALFMEDQLSLAFDHALNTNPSLMDHFDRVEVVLVDRPNLCLPKRYAENDQWPEIAERYLRYRNGDALIADAVPSSNAILAYQVPIRTINLIHEYYAKADHLHLTTVVWSAIDDHIKKLPSVGLRLFYLVTGDSLIILGESGGHMTFTKTYFVSDSKDLHYYILACNKLMQPVENWAVTVDNEPNDFMVNELPDFTFDQTLPLAELRTLIARHRACAS